MEKKRNRTLAESQEIQQAAIDSSFSELRNRLDTANVLLLDYAERIKSLSPGGHNSIIPHLHVCSKSGCLGCLHVRWKRYFDPAKDQKKRNAVYGRSVNEKEVKSGFYSADIKNPLNRLPRGDEFEELRDTVKVFVAVVEARKKLVSHLSNALKSSSSLLG